MNINLNKLIAEVNKKFVGNANLVILEYMDDNQLRISIGDTSCFYFCNKFNNVLSAHNANLKDEAVVYGILSKHIVNQLNASRGEKVYPEILTVKSDYI
jgi:hypothetical protein